MTAMAMSSPNSKVRHGGGYTASPAHAVIGSFSAPRHTVLLLYLSLSDAHPNIQSSSLLSLSLSLSFAIQKYKAGAFPPADGCQEAAQRRRRRIFAVPPSQGPSPFGIVRPRRLRQRSSICAGGDVELSKVVRRRQDVAPPLERFATGGCRDRCAGRRRNFVESDGRDGAGAQS